MHHIQLLYRNNWRGEVVGTLEDKTVSQEALLIAQNCFCDNFIISGVVSYLNQKKCWLSRGQVNKNSWTTMLTLIWLKMSPFFLFLPADLNIQMFCPAMSTSEQKAFSQYDLNELHERTTASDRCTNVKQKARPKRTAQAAMMKVWIKYVPRCISGSKNRWDYAISTNSRTSVVTLSLCLRLLMTCHRQLPWQPFMLPHHIYSCHNNSTQKNQDTVGRWRANLAMFENKWCPSLTAVDAVWVWQH